MPTSFDFNWSCVSLTKTEFPKEEPQLWGLKQKKWGTHTREFLMAGALSGRTGDGWNSLPFLSCYTDL